MLVWLPDTVELLLCERLSPDVRVDDPEPLADRVADEDTVPVKVDTADPLVVADTSPEADSRNDALPLGVRGALADALGLPDTVRVAVLVPEPVLVTAAVAEPVTCAVAVRVPAADCVSERGADALAVLDGLPVLLADTVPVTDTVRLRGVDDWLDVADGEPLGERLMRGEAVLLRLALLLPVDVSVPDTEPAGVALPVPAGVALTLPLSVCVRVDVGLADVEPVTVSDTVLEGDALPAAVSLGAIETVGVPRLVGEALPDTLIEGLPRPDAEGLVDVLGLRLSRALPECVTVLLALPLP